MSVDLEAASDLLAVPGFVLGTASAEIKYAGRTDIAVVFAGEKTRTAGVFTRNSFVAAPVLVSQAHLKQAHSENDMAPRALIINSGNANAATGKSGYVDAVESCRYTADLLGLAAEQVLPFSTGVIGERLPMDRLKSGIKAARNSLSNTSWLDAAKAIMTTDTVPKGLSRSFNLGDSKVTITAIAKGSGMLRPNMATMLAFVATDAAINQMCLEQLLSQAAERSFNRITVDGDTSTNDSLVLMASCEAAHACIETAQDAHYQSFKNELDALCIELAQNLVRDAEGATRFITLSISGGRDAEDCLKVAYTIAESPLVKTALFAGDPNWGRFCMAIGRAGIEDLDVTRVSLHIGGVCVAQGGELDADYDEAQAAAVMQENAYSIKVGLGRGACSETLWTSDLSYEYVKINAEYRS